MTRETTIPLEPQAALAEALHLFQCWRGDPLTTLTPALSSPDSIEAGLLRAWLLVLGTEPLGYDDARAQLSALDLASSTRRQCDHVEALGEFIAGEWSAAARRLEDLSLSHPLDALALQAGHMLDYFLGDARMLRERILRALPHWRPGEQGRHAVLAMAAFGACECGDYDEAERLGRAALEQEPLDAWAHHAVAHAYEMRGDTRGGIAWMQMREAEWGAPSYLAVHNTWHWALFLISEGRLIEAMELYDRRVRGEGSRQLVDLVDASALLLRLRLAGAEPGDRWHPVLHDWTEVLVAGECLFNDLHAAWAALGAERTDLLEGLLEAHRRAAERAGGERDRLSAALGVPLMEAVLALAHGRPGVAVGILREQRPRLHQMGGSRAQRELLDLVLIEAALRAGQAALAAGLIHARSLQRTPSPEQVRIGSPLAATA